VHNAVQSTVTALGRRASAPTVRSSYLHYRAAPVLLLLNNCCCISCCSWEDECRNVDRTAPQHLHYLQRDIVSQGSPGVDVDNSNNGIVVKYIPPAAENPSPFEVISRIFPEHKLTFLEGLITSLEYCLTDMLCTVYSLVGICSVVL